MPNRTPKTETATVTDIKQKVAKQGELTGIEAPSHPALNTLMEEHAATSTQLGQARQRLGEINEQLLETAEKLKVEGAYRHPTAVPGLVLTIKKGSPKVKVAQAKAEVEDEEASDE